MTMKTRRHVENGVVWYLPIEIKPLNGYRDYTKRKDKRKDKGPNKINDLTPLYPCESLLSTPVFPAHKRLRWLCACDCGNYVIVFAHAMSSGKILCCGKCQSQHGAYVLEIPGHYPLEAEEPVKTERGEDEDLKQLEKTIDSVFTPDDGRKPRSKDTCRVRLDDISKAKKIIDKGLDPQATLSRSELESTAGLNDHSAYKYLVASKQIDYMTARFRELGMLIDELCL